MLTNDYGTITTGDRSDSSTQDIFCSIIQVFCNYYAYLLTKSDIINNLVTILIIICVKIDVIYIRNQ